MDREYTLTTTPIGSGEFDLDDMEDFPFLMSVIWDSIKYDDLEEVRINVDH